MKIQSIYFFIISIILVFSACTKDPITGCNDATACNYSSEAEEDDGSCDYTTCAGCTDATACNYSSTATIIDNESCQFPLDNPINITSYDDVVVGPAGEELTSYFYIQNASCSTININAKQTSSPHPGTGATFRICLGDFCYDLGVNESVYPLPLDSFDEGGYFEGYLMAPDPGNYNVTYRFSTDTHDQEVTVEFQFN